jgi:hypothetical protein
MARTTFIQTLVSQQIRRMIAEAIRDGDVLSASGCAAKIISTYPNYGLVQSDVAYAVAHAAARMSVPVEMGERQTLTEQSRKRQRELPGSTEDAKQPLILEGWVVL